METTLTPEQAFRAMFLFLDGYWSEFKTANLADVLGDLQPAEKRPIQRSSNVGRLAPRGRSCHALGAPLRARAAGADVTDLEMAPVGDRRFTATDPEGEVWVFAQRIDS
jgi:hypothetical protein